MSNVPFRPAARVLSVLAVFVLIAATLTAQRRASTDRRVPTARPSATIFSPLPLPTPNTVRLASGMPGPDYWQQQVDYSMDIALNDETHVVRATERITYHNNSPEPIDFIWMNLPQNIQRPDSLVARATGGGGRFAIGENSPKGFTISDIKSRGKALTLTEYGTVGRIDLPQPIPAHSTFAFQLTFEFEVPSSGTGRMGIRKGKQGPVFELAQWFPNVCVYDDVYGWNTLPYLGAGEFYTNFGSYDMRITVPRDHIVAATGVLQNPKEVLTPKQLRRLAKAKKSPKTTIIRGADEVEDPKSRPQGNGPLTWHFKADKVRTFAWASSKAFIWDASFLKDSGPDGKGTLVQSVYPVEAEHLWKESTEMLRFAIAGYNKRWFRYPYPSATNVNGVAGGMEYPMIIFCSTRRGRRSLYGVTAHEIGHNWFPMVVNTDERRHAWMDEGFNTFINHYSEEEFFGKGSSGRTAGRAFARMMKIKNQPPIDTPPDRLDRMFLGMLEYSKTGVGMRLLREQILGPERFDFAFRTYIAKWAFKSPQPADFFRCMENAAGRDLAWFWRGWFLEATTLDQAVADVKLGRRGKRWNVTFKNKGEMVMPLVYEATLEDGTKIRRTIPVDAWAASNTVTMRLDTQGKAISEVVVDPDAVFPDVDPDNNTWSAQEASEKKADENKDGDGSTKN